MFFWFQGRIVERQDGSFVSLADIRLRACAGVARRPMLLLLPPSSIEGSSISHLSPLVHNKIVVHTDGGAALIGTLAMTPPAQPQPHVGSFMASFHYGRFVHNLTKKLCEGLHYRCESLPSCIHCDVGAAQNLQPIEICDEKGSQHARIGIRSELSGFLSPHDRLSIGFFEEFQPAPNAHAHELILSAAFDRANLKKADSRRGLEREDLFEAPNNRCAGWSTPQIVNVCLPVQSRCSGRETPGAFRACCRMHRRSCFC